MGDIKKFLIDGTWRESDMVEDVIFPYTGETIAQVYQATEGQMQEAIASVTAGFEMTRKMPAHQRADILYKLADLMEARRDDLIEAMILEGGKVRKVATGELNRAQQTIRFSAEEAKRIGGDVIPMDAAPNGENRFGFVKRVPVGPVLGITPFNYPVNLGCHKLGPAIAAGNSIVIKPAEDTPLSTLILAELILEAGFPPQALAIIPAVKDRAEPMVRDDRFKFLSFTGSSSVGWHLKSIAGRKPVGLELGGNAGVIVHNDANLDYAAQRCVTGGFTNAGQNCISVQRVIIHNDVFDEMTEKMLHYAAQQVVGDPRHAETDIGPMIRMRDAERAEMWLQEAIQEGAEVLYGGGRDGIMIEPTLITNIRPEMKVTCQEVFAPLINLIPYTDFDEAIDIANNTDYGLQGGLFTQDFNRMMHAFDKMEVGGLHVNEASTFRVDHMPYGGVKSSGLGREGVRYAIDHMTEHKLMVVNLPGGTTPFASDK